MIARNGLALALMLVVGSAGRVAADGAVDLGGMVYYEAGGPLHMVVVNPEVHVEGAPNETVAITAGHEADVVSGASVAIVDGGDPDVITTATLLDDDRHVVSAGLELRDEYSSIAVSYAFGTEKDYRSHSVTVAARTELFERNTAFTLSYARSFDGVCSLRQDAAQEPVDRVPLPNSDGCFTAADRSTLSLDVHTLQAGWTQVWTPIYTTQLTFTSQVLNGFQSNPYRGVWLGTAAPQEHHPENRARYSIALGNRVWLQRMRGALSLDARLYTDSWDIQSVTAEVGYDQYLSDAVRVRASARYYLQSAAGFYSDDYAFMPRGQYFTGDRELSQMSSWDMGARLTYEVPPDDEGKVLFLGSLRFVLAADYIRYDFPDFHYGNVAVPNNQAMIVALALEGTS